jgi:hypothetical protein
VRRERGRGGKPGGAASTTAAGAESGVSENAPDMVLTDEMALMLGTLKLDEVGLAPDSAQASELLLLWQAYQSLATSDTAASQEMEAVLKQIQQAMTDEQLAAIGGMDLDSEDLRGLMESFRQEAAAGDSRSAEGFFPGGGQPPERGPSGWAWRRIRSPGRAIRRFLRGRRRGFEPGDAGHGAGGTDRQVGSSVGALPPPTVDR